MIAKVLNNRGKASGAEAKMLVGEDDFRYVVDGFRSGIRIHKDIEWHLRGVMTDTFAHPGSLARAQLAYALLKARGFSGVDARSVGVALEYFHTASLLFDDLPCMDNAEKRRGHSCPHVVHGESSAILGALALINQAYALLWNVMNRLPERSRSASADLVNECLGMNGILNGQAFDLHFSESDRGMDDVLRIARGKTVTLIRLTLMLPALMTGAGEVELACFETLSLSWGLAYQILDDFKDCLMNSGETGKTTLRDGHLSHPNLPLALGYDKALAVLNDHLAASASAISVLSGMRVDVTSLHRLQSLLTSEQKRMVALVQDAISRHSAPVL